MVRFAAAQVEKLAPQVIVNLANDLQNFQCGFKHANWCVQVLNAARLLAARPQSKVAQENMDSFAKNWQEKVDVLTLAVDSIITIDDFLAVSGEYLQYWNKHSRLNNGLINFGFLQSLTFWTTSTAVWRRYCIRMLRLLIEPLEPYVVERCGYVMWSTPTWSCTSSLPTLNEWKTQCWWRGKKVRRSYVCWSLSLSWSQSQLSFGFCSCPGIRRQSGFGRWRVEPQPSGRCGLGWIFWGGATGVGRHKGHPSCGADEPGKTE